MAWACAVDWCRKSNRKGAENAEGFVEEGDWDGPSLTPATDNPWIIPHESWAGKRTERPHDERPAEADDKKVSVKKPDFL